jgi:uncharacterized protein YjbI with pentapeptide repeats
MHTNFDDLIADHKKNCIKEDCCIEHKAAKENGKRFEIESIENFTKIRIDDCLIDSQEVEKCDFGFVRNSNNDFYFVELKGNKIEKAYNQIIETIKYFERDLIKIPQNKKYGFIVSSSGIPKAQIRINNLKQDFAKGKYGVKLEIQNMVIKHKPS